MITGKCKAQKHKNSRGNLNAPVILHHHSNIYGSYYKLRDAVRQKTEGDSAAGSTDGRKRAADERMAVDAGG